MMGLLPPPPTFVQDVHKWRHEPVDFVKSSKLPECVLTCSDISFAACAQASTKKVTGANDPSKVLFRRRSNVSDMFSAAPN